VRVCESVRECESVCGWGEKGAKCDTLMVWRLVKHLACHLSGNNNEEDYEYNYVYTVRKNIVSLIKIEITMRL